MHLSYSHSILAEPKISPTAARQHRVQWVPAWARPVILTAMLLAGGLQVSGQELSRSVVGTAGSYFSAVNVGNLHWTVGEIAVTRTENGLVLERGFHQGLSELIATSVWTAPEVQLELSVYPNPTANDVTLTGDWQPADRLRITDLLGRVVTEQALPAERAEIRLSDQPAGTYLLTLARAGRPLKTMKVIRR